MRRWTASYFAPNFLLPPYELLMLGALLRNEGARPWLIDAQAERLSRDAFCRRVVEGGASALLALLGFSSLPEDLRVLSMLRERAPQVKQIAFGHLPTLFAAELLRGSTLDAVIRGEPEPGLTSLLTWLAGGAPGCDSPLVTRADIDRGTTPTKLPLPESNLDSLPFPDHSLVRREAYCESFMPRPLAITMTARGCPFRCVFCVRSFGDRARYRGLDNVTAELETRGREGFRHMRFLDDCFTVPATRALAIASRLRAVAPGMSFTALGRMDHLTADELQELARAGCRRLYVGIETVSPRLLQLLNKPQDLTGLERAVRAARRAGIEVSGFFIVGIPGETREDVQASLDFALRVRLDYCIVTRLQYWPGTQLFVDHQRERDFGVVPYRNSARAPQEDAEAFRRERWFYRRFLLSPPSLWRRARTAVTSPLETLAGVWAVLRHQLSRSPTDLI